MILPSWQLIIFFNHMQWHSFREEVDLDISDLFWIWNHVEPVNLNDHCFYIC